MGIFPACFQRLTLEVGGTYLMCNGNEIKEVVFKKSSDRGFSFFNPDTGKKLGKGHLYPLEINRMDTKLTFWLPKHLRITKKEQ